MPNPCQEPPASSRSPFEDLKDIDVLCCFKNKIESSNLENWCIKDKWPYQNKKFDSTTQSGTSSNSKVPNFDLKDMDVLSTYKIHLDSKIWNMGLSNTSYFDFGTLQDVKLFWAKLIWVIIEFESWASLSQSQLYLACLYWYWLHSDPFLADLSQAELVFNIVTQSVSDGMRYRVLHLARG